MTPDQRIQKTVFILKAFTHPARLSILAQLAAKGAHDQATLEKKLIKQPAELTHHLIHLLNKKLIRKRKMGNNVTYELTSPRVIAIVLTFVNTWFIQPEQRQASEAGTAKNWLSDSSYPPSQRA